ncbi:hypothetical protein KR018_006092 [Drosophila ironensis]|nr:hypothetical protein KR018_006092 [Drosophila ironensis]
MAFRYIFVFGALVVLAQGSYLTPVEQESLEGSLHAGGVSAGAPVAGIPQGRPAVAQPHRPVVAQPHRPVVAQPQRPISGHGAVNAPIGGIRRVGGSGVGGPRGHGGRPAGGSHNRPGGRPAGGKGGRPIGGGAGHGNAHQNRNPKPY